VNIFKQNNQPKPKKEMKMHSNGDTPMPNILARGTKIKGDLETEGDIRIDGSVVGKVLAKGKIVVGSGGYVEGEVFCKTIDVSGEVKANVKSGALISLKATAKFTGNIITPKISIEPGALFVGECKMDSAEKLQGDEPKQKEKK
jgi:cytoskeletal protein CcmA (bactofilin family)